MISGTHKGLAQDYASFDLLWFDIESKVRGLMNEIVEPVIDRLVENTDLVNQTKLDQERCNDKIEDLRDTVF